MCTGFILCTFPIVVMTKTTDSGKDRSSFPLLTQVQYRRQSCSLYLL